MLRSSEKGGDTVSVLGSKRPRTRTQQTCCLRSVSMATLTGKQRRWLAALTGLLLTAALPDMLSATPQCAEEGSPCGGLRCCGEMLCHFSRPGLRLDPKGICQRTKPTECRPDLVPPRDYYLATLHASFFGGYHYKGDARLDVSTCKSEKFGRCMDMSNSTVGGEVSSLTWSENVVLVVYDSGSCGGNSVLVYSAGPYKRVLDDGNTRTQGFLAGGIPDLRKVCKHDSCGYTSSAETPQTAVCPIVNNAACKCVETWDDSIRSYKLFERRPSQSAFDGWRTVF